MIRVLVVDDSITVRKHLVELLEEDPAFEVVGEAGDGRRAIELCEQLRPDVLTMDMMLPIMTGLAATEYIMAFCPTPIVIISSSMNRGEVFKTYDAIAAGAVDVLAKPEPGAGPEWIEKFKSTLRIASRVRVVTHPRGKLTPALGLPSTAPGPSSSVKLVAIGASTGGPAAVRKLLLDLPGDFGLPVLLVLHVAEPFDASMVDWLDAQTPHSVCFAREGEPVLGMPPRVVMGTGGRHMYVENGKIRFNSGPERHSCRPSIDVLFESLARELAPVTAAALLTGMGRDGAEGLLAIRRAGGQTIAQDEATSVIWGMPRAAVEIGAAQSVLPLDAIAGELVRLRGHR